MDLIRAYYTKAKAFLKAHLAARIAVIILSVFVGLWLILHPVGTKTFLLLGMDNFGSLEEIGRSDVTMLVQVDFTRARLSTVTFARDMFIENENGNLTKINTIVKNKGEQGLCDLIEQNFGVHIDGWFRVNFTSVVQLVDAIGGVEIELTRAEANYIDQKEGTYPLYPLSEGLCRLNGGQALAYARCRKLDNDLGRGERQSKLISAAVRQTRYLTAARVADVFTTLKHAWRSSYSLPEQIRLAFQALWLRGAKVQSFGMPFEGHWRYDSVRDTSGIVADLEANKLLLLEALGRPVPKAASAP